MSIFSKPYEDPDKPQMSQAVKQEAIKIALRLKRFLAPDHSTMSDFVLTVKVKATNWLVRGYYDFAKDSPEGVVPVEALRISASVAKAIKKMQDKVSEMLFEYAPFASLELLTEATRNSHKAMHAFYVLIARCRKDILQLETKINDVAALIAELTVGHISKDEFGLAINKQFLKSC